MKKINIYSIHFDRPEFIRWQYDSFKKHLIDNFEYIVVNNASDEKIGAMIDETCRMLLVTTIRTRSNSNIAGKHHVDSFNKVWKEYATQNKNIYSVMIDGDCFLVKHFSINYFMKNYVLAGPKQQRNYNYHYLTPTIIIADTDNLPNAETIDWEGIGIIENNKEIRLDTGGGLYNYYCAHPEIKDKTKELKSSWHIKDENKNKHCIPDELTNLYRDEYNIEFFGNEFLHYCRSSNWDHQTKAHHVNKSNFVEDFIYGTIYNRVMAKEHNFQIDNDTYFGWGKK